MDVANFLPNEAKGGGVVSVQFLKGQVAGARFILVLRECIWNAAGVFLVLPAFDDTGSLGSLPRHVGPWFDPG